ncbi:MAG: SLC13 family permease [bacterium]
MNETKGIQLGKPHSLLERRSPSAAAFLFSRKTISLFFVLLLSAIGYMLGPADLQSGPYDVHIQATVNGQPLQITHPIHLGDSSSEPQQFTYPAGDYQVVVNGSQSYANELGESIAYQVQIVDESGRPLDLAMQEITSILTNAAGYEQELPPTDREGQSLSFTMRLPYRAQVVTGLLFAVALLWVTEVVPLAAAALLIPVVVVVAGITSPDTVFQPFFHPIVVLFFAGFLLAEGMRRTGVDRVLALNILSRASLKPAFLMLTMMGLSAFLSMWMSNTASVAVLIPIAIAVLDKLPNDGQPTGYRRALILGLAYAATVGGIGSAIGTPANILAMTFLNDLAGTRLGFADWFAYGLPIVLIMVPVIWLYLLLVFRVRFRDLGAQLTHNIYDRELKDLGRLKTDQRILLIIFVAIIALWLTDRWHGVHTSIVALGGVLLLFLSQAITKEDLNRINWNALLTFGGGLALGNMLVLTGASDWLALQLTGLSTLPPLLVVFLVAGLTLVIGAFISNTACAAMLIPLAIPLAQILYIDPRLLVVIIAIASSIDFALVVGTPPTMMAYATGYFEVQDIFKRGVVLDVIGILILSFGVIWIWRLLGMVTF